MIFLSWRLRATYSITRARPSWLRGHQQRLCWLELIDGVGPTLRPSPCAASRRVVGQDAFGGHSDVVPLIGLFRDPHDGTDRPRRLDANDVAHGRFPITHWRPPE